MLNNKRYILTQNSIKRPQLWSVENGRPVKEWQTKTYQQVAQMLQNEYDLQPKTTEKSNTSASATAIVPKSWFTVDIKIGVRS